MIGNVSRRIACARVELRDWSTVSTIVNRPDPFRETIPPLEPLDWREQGAGWSGKLLFIYSVIPAVFTKVVSWSKNRRKVDSIFLVVGQNNKHLIFFYSPPGMRWWMTALLFCPYAYF